MSRGFTFIETLVYLALFTLIIGGFVAASYGLFENTGRNQTKAMVQDEENFIMGKILWALESASGVDTSVPNRIIITPYSGPAITISTSTTNIIWNGAAQYLNNSNVTVKNLSFIHVGSGTNPESVGIDLTLTAKSPNGATVTESASSTRFIRK